MYDDAASGNLIYVVGPSGSGKDAVIISAKEKLNKIKYLLFSPRYVTRLSSNPGELPISHDAFEHYQLSGHFALYWQAHGLHYGVSIIIDHQMRNGRTVVVNGSRGNVQAALSRYPHMTVVNICVPPGIARQRLLARRREDAVAIAARVARAPAFNVPPAQLVTIDNSGPLEYASAAFERVLTGRRERRFGFVGQASAH